MLERYIAEGEMKKRKAFLMRIDRKLWAQLEAWAQDELRSVNGQIEIILRQAVQKNGSEGIPSKRWASKKQDRRNKLVSNIA